VRCCTSTVDAVRARARARGPPGRDAARAPSHAAMCNAERRCTSASCAAPSEPVLRPERFAAALRALSSSRVAALTVADSAGFCLCSAWSPTSGYGADPGSRRRRADVGRGRPTNRARGERHGNIGDAGHYSDVSPKGRRPRRRDRRARGLGADEAQRQLAASGLERPGAISSPPRVSRRRPPARSRRPRRVEDGAVRRSSGSPRRSHPPQRPPPPPFGQSGRDVG
jgi:hypothetical protein